ncbi:MAG: tetratricopeptide repeat protein [Candidatus Methanofastidiosia archaeon]
MESKAHHLFKEGAAQYDAANYTEAEINLTEALTLYKKLEKKDKTYTFNVASTLYNLACIYQETEKTQKAESLYYKALKKYRELAQKAPDIYNPYTAMTLHSLALLYWKRRNVKKAELMYYEAIKTYRTFVQENPEYAPELGDVLNNAGGLYFYTGDFTSAETVFKEALHVYRDLTSRTPEYLPDVAMALNNLAVLFHNTGNFNRAEKMYKEALQTYRTLAEKNPQYTGNVAAALNNLGLYYWKIEEFKKAELIYTKALSLYRDLASRTPEYLPDVAMTLGNLGLLYTAIGKFKKAESMYTKALSLYRELSKQNVIYAFNVGGILSNLGSLYAVTKKFKKAEKACKEVLTVYRDLEKKDPDAYKPYVAMALQNLGDTLDDFNNLNEAEKAFTQALNLYRTLAETHAAYTPYVAMGLSSLGDLYVRMGRLQKAEEAVTEALTLYRTLAETHPVYMADVATTLGRLGAFYINTSKFSQSEKAFTQALAIERDLARKNPEVYTPRMASVFNGLGVLYSDMGSVKKAEAMYMKALKTRKTLAEKDPDVYTPNVATVLNNLGALYWNNNSFLKAEKAFSEALTIKQALSQSNPAVWEPDVAMILNNLGNVYWKMGTPKSAEDMYKKALAIREKWGLWFEAAESMSGLSLLSHDKIEDAVKLLELSIFFSEDKKYRYVQKGKREVLYLNALEYTDDPQRTVGILEALRDQDLLSLEWNLKEEVLKEKNKKRIVKDLLKKKIPPLKIPFLLPDDLLILYIQYKEDHVLYTAVTKERTAIVRGTPSFVEVGSRLLKNLYIQLYAQTRGRSVDTLIDDFERCTIKWGQIIPQEIQEELLQKKYIVFSPDFNCSPLPLEGLLFDGEPLCLSKSVARTTSAHLLKEIASREVAFNSSLIVGNPWPSCDEDSFHYSSPSVEGRFGLTDIGPITYLEGAQKEAQTLNRTFPRARVLTNSLATADRILKELPHHSLIHLAGHGNGGRILFFSGPMTRIPPEFEPELFSNLRKAWRVSNSGTVYMMDEWDFITDIDILNTPLQKGTFVFLNACETGKHTYGGGGHFQGLAQAFLKSGASNVISSLVPVFDEPSTDFSVSFYNTLRSQHSVVTALRNTRRCIRKKYKAQIYWLPYIHYGSPLALHQ